MERKRHQVDRFRQHIQEFQCLLRSLGGADDRMPTKKKKKNTNEDVNSFYNSKSHNYGDPNNTNAPLVEMSINTCPWSCCCSGC